MASKYLKESSATDGYLLEDGSGALLLEQYVPSRPSAHDTAHVKATTSVAGDGDPWDATDPANSIVGSATGKAWLAAAATNTNQRLHIDIDTAKAVKRIYFENFHDSGGSTTNGAKNFTVWGSNDAGAFSTLTYGTDTNWTEITASVNQLPQHAASDVADPQYVDLTNATAYRYYAIKFADAWGGSQMGIRRIELLVEVDAATAVPTDLQTNWDVLTAVAPTMQTNWDVLVAVTTSEQTNWDITAAIATSGQTNWDVLVATTTSGQTNWDIIAAVDTGAQTNYDIVAAVVTATQTNWDIIAVVITSGQTNWDVLIEAATSGQTNYDVLIGADTATQTNWDVLAAVVTTLSTNWTNEGFKLTINGVDRSSYIDTDTFEYEQVANDEVDTCNFTLVIPASEFAAIKPSTRQDVVLTLNGIRVFAGEIIDIAVSERSFRVFDVKCNAKDYSHLFTSPLAIETYTDKSVLYILNSLLNGVANYVNKVIDPMEGEWSRGTPDSVNVVEGTQGLKIINEASEKDIDLDLTLFNNGQPSTTDDYIEFWYKIEGDINGLEYISVKYGDAALTSYYEKQVTSGYISGWNFFRFAKSSFTATGTPDWAAIEKVVVESKEPVTTTLAYYDVDTYDSGAQYAASAGEGSVAVTIDDMRMTPANAIDKGFISDTFGTISGTLRFNYVPLFQAIQQLADLVGAYWYVDPQRGFHFGAAGFETAAFNITDTNGMMTLRSLVLDEKSANLKNTLYVRGGLYLGEARNVQIELGDGEKTSWDVNYRGTALRVFTDTGAGYEERTVGLDNLNADDGTYEWFWNNTEKFVRQATFGAPAALDSSDKIKIDLFPYLPLIVVVTDQPSIAANGFRKEEYLIVDKNIRDIATARARGLAELKAYKDDLIEGQFQTLQVGLVAGQQINVTSALRGVNEDFIIWSISATMHTNTKLRYTVKLVSKRKLTLVNTLIKLLLEKTSTVEVSDDEIVDDVESHLEALRITEAHSATKTTVVPATYDGAATYDGEIYTYS